MGEWCTKHELVTFWSLDFILKILLSTSRLSLFYCASLSFIDHKQLKFIFIFNEKLLMRTILNTEYWEELMPHIN